MPNLYRATCYRCGQTVEPGEGDWHYPNSDEWQAWPQIRGMKNKPVLVQHTDCQVKYDGTTIHHIYQPENT